MPPITENPPRFSAAGSGNLSTAADISECIQNECGTQGKIAARKREIAAIAFNEAGARDAHCILGVDIGAEGALAHITPSGDLLEIADMPIPRDGPKNRATINGLLLAEIIHRWQPTEAFIEHVPARPHEGAVGAFAFGHSRGVIESVLAACGVPMRFIAPASWKRAVGLTFASKDASRSEAIRRWPGHAALFARVMDDCRVEAALIAVAGLARACAKGRAP